MWRPVARYPMSIRVGGASLKGARSENQDRFFVRVSPDGERAIGAIADGIGGLADGAGAAAAAVEAVRPVVSPLAGAALLQAIRNRPTRGAPGVTIRWAMFSASGGALDGSTQTAWDSASYTTQ